MKKCHLHSKCLSCAYKIRMYKAQRRNKKITSLTKALTLLLSITLLSASAFGCTSSDNSQKSSKIAMGRYVEKAVDMPEAVQSGNNSVSRVINNPNGLIELYCIPESSEDGSNFIQYTLNKKNTWEKTVPKWLNKKDTEVYNITYAPNGTKYAILISHNSDNSENIRFLKSTDNITAKEIYMEDYKGAVSLEKQPSTMSILEDNSILLSFIKSDNDVHGSYIIYKNGKRIGGFKAGSYKYALSGNKLLTVNENWDEGVIIDAATGKTKATIPVNSYNYRNQFASDHKGNWYMLSEAGVQRMIKDGNTWETILNGSQAFMSKLSQRVESMFFGSDDDFYITYSTRLGDSTLMHYVYDKNTPTVPDTTLSVVSLYSSDTLKESISDFNRENPDVQIDYKELITDDNGGTASDLIKKINTELLSGKGPDILVLDGLPVDSYIEKNILADMSSTISPMLESGELLGGIINNYKTKDGHIYTIPLRFSTFFAYGDREAVAHTKSINNLADYAKTARLPLFGEKTLSYSDICRLLYVLYSDSFLDDHNGFQREGLINFLQQLKIISDQTVTIPERTIGTETGDYLRSVYTKLIYDKKALLGIINIYDIKNTYQPILATDKIGGAYSIINKLFAPKEMMGVNNSSEQKEQAMKFIKTLLSKSIQKIALYDGLPVNAEAMDIFGMDDRYTQGLDGDTKYIRLDKKKIQPIHKLLTTAAVPFVTDLDLLDIVVVEAERYLNGNNTLEATADKIIANAAPYLSEHKKE